LYLLPAGTFSQIVPLIINIYIGVPLPLSAFQMIVICILTDVAPSLSMMFEKSEGDLLERPPRVIGRDRLVDVKLLMYAYFFLGVLETFFSNFIFCVYLYWYGGFGPSQVFLAYESFAPLLSDDDRNNLIYTGQTISFATLVIVQTFGNHFVTRTRKLSLFQSLPILKPHRNLFLFIAQLIAVAIMLILIYVPVFNSIFKTAPIPVQFYFIPLVFCILFIVVDEIRKLALRMGLRSSNPSWFFRLIIKWAW
jgi:sodium/potassium-transporting ATPase subunit alpha